MTVQRKLLARSITLHEQTYKVEGSKETRIPLSTGAELQVINNPDENGLSWLSIDDPHHPPFAETRGFVTDSRPTRLVDPDLLIGSVVVIGERKNSNPERS